MVNKYRVKGKLLDTGEEIDEIVTAINPGEAKNQINNIYAKNRRWELVIINQVIEID